MTTTSPSCAPILPSEFPSPNAAMTLAARSTPQQTVINNVNIINSTINNIRGNSSTTIHNNPISSATAEANQDAQIHQGFTTHGTFNSVIQIMPRLTTMFTGRTDILERLAGFLDPSKPSLTLKKQRVFVLYGLGGGGKTQIMVKFVIDFGNSFDVIYYVDATTMATIQSSFENIARSASAGSTADDALRWLSQQRSEWLLLIDNADDPEINLQQFFPRCVHGNILITTRNPHCRRHAPDSNAHVASMNPNDAVELLLKSSMIEHTVKSRDTAVVICQELGYLALAIAQAGAYIAHACSLHDYLQLYRTDRAKLLQSCSVQAVDDYKWTVYATWGMSVERLTPTTAMLLRLFAFIHHDGIPLALLQHAAAAANDQESFRNAADFLANFRSESGDWSNEMFFSGIRELASYSLINVDAKCQMYSIHPLVHSWARECASPVECSEAQICVLQLLALSTPWGQDQASYAFRRTLLPHLDVVCAMDLNQVDINILGRFFHIYHTCGWWRAAAKVQRAHVEVVSRRFGDMHQNTLISQGNLAWTYGHLGCLKEAEVLQLQVLEIRQKVLGPDHPDTIISMSNLAMTYWQQERWKEAEALQVQVLRNRQKTLGPEDPDILLSMSNLALTYHHQQRWKEAEVLQAQAFKISREVLGLEHPDTVISMANLALNYQDQGRWMEAKVLQAQVLEIRQRILGQEHPTTLFSMSRLSSIYQVQRQWKEAEMLEMQAMELGRRILGQEHPDTISSMVNLAWIYWNQERWQEAEVLQVQTLEISQRVLGQDHPDTICRVGDLALTYQKQGCLKKAEVLQVQVVEIRQKLLGQEHPSTLRGIGNLALTYWKQGQWKEAKVLQGQVMKITQRTDGWDHPHALQVLRHLAGTFRDQQQWTKAHQLEEELLERQKKVLGDDHSETIDTVARLQQCVSPRHVSWRQPTTWLSHLKSHSTKSK